MVKVFCPSPSRMALPTLQHGVSETGERFARIVLHPKQMDVLQEAPECLYLNGPPGTGKTLMLVLQASGWLLQGHKVLAYTSYTFVSISTSLGRYYSVTPTFYMLLECPSSTSRYLHVLAVQNGTSP